MSDRFIEMLILHQRIETVLEITFVVALLAAAVFLAISSLSDRLRASGRILKAGLLASAVAIACFLALPNVRRTHWEQRDRALAEDRRAYEVESAGLEANCSEPSEEQSSGGTTDVDSQLQSGALRSSRAAER